VDAPWPSSDAYIHLELHAPGAFKGLVSLDIEFVPLDDDDVLYFHHLPGLQYLSLRDTCITNTASVHLFYFSYTSYTDYFRRSIYLLSSHRNTLIQLDICCNWDIDDDAIVPLLKFKKLKYLHTVGTGITMEGLRRYAKAMHEAKRVIHIDIPEECEQELLGVQLFPLPTLGF
jgi:predicted protein tyrosine phosphatase